MHAIRWLLVPITLLSAVLAAPVGAASFVVNDFGDDADANVGDGVCDIPIGGPPRCTLRAAIQEANVSSTSVDTITFGLGLIVISVGSALPTATGHTIIDGRTAPGYNGSATVASDAPPSVYIDGSALGGTSADGLRFLGGRRFEVHALGIINFPDNGIEVIDGTVAHLDRNWIGVGRTGFAAGNGDSGVYLDNCDRCRVGKHVPVSGDVEGIGNVIGNNGEDGIYVLTGQGNAIGGNDIGLDPVGSADFGNGRHGIQLVGPDNFVGQFRGTGPGTALTSPNVITNNNGDGIVAITGGQSILTNLVYGNSGNGVVLNGSGSRLGFVVEGMRNFIQGNGGHGVVLGPTFAAFGTTVQNNWIYQNGQRGVQVTGGSGNEILLNDIFENMDGVRIDAAGNTLRNNRIGMLADLLVGNGFNGVVLASSDNVVANNLIVGSDDDGIDVFSGAGNQITGNMIGTDDSGENLGNLNIGVRVRAAATNTRIAGNTIGFSVDGIRLEGSGTSVCDNLIGLDAFARDINNLFDGVRVLGGGNTIGNASAGCIGNLIGFNDSDGIEIAGDANIVRHNLIGAVTGVDSGNALSGLHLVNGADLNLITSNVVQDNSGPGIRTTALSGTRNRIQGNDFDRNNGLAIDLGDDGATANDAGDADSGPNNLQNTPVLTAVFGAGGLLHVSYFIDSQLAASTYPIEVDFYVNGNVTSGGVRVYNDTYNLAPGATRSISFDPGDAAAFLSAHATDLEGNSSEFTATIEYVIPFGTGLFADGFEDP